MTTTATTAQAVADKIRETAARLADEIDPKDGWDEAARRYALKEAVVFSVTSGVVVFGTPVSCPSFYGRAARRIWPEICRQAAITAIDLATEDLDLDGVIRADAAHAVLFEF